MDIFAVRSLYWQAWSLSCQLPKPCWGEAASPTGLCYRSCWRFCHKLIKLGVSKLVSVEANPAGWASGSPPRQMTKSWSCEIASLEKYKCNMNRSQWHQRWCATAPKGTGLWLSFSGVCLSSSLINKHWDPKGLQANKDHSHCFWFPKRTPCLPFRMSLE